MQRLTRGEESVTGGSLMVPSGLVRRIQDAGLSTQLRQGWEVVPTRTKGHGLLLVLLVLTVFLGRWADNGLSAAELASRQERVLVADTTNSGEADEASTVYIAANVATQLNLSVAQEVIKHAENLNTAANVTVQPTQSVVTAGATRREVVTYVVKSGDTLAAIAKKFGINADTITWANNLSGELLPNTELRIPPVSGVLYTVTADDTLASVAERFNAAPQDIVSFNDLELSGLQRGAKIMIPDGVKPQPVPAPITVAPVASFPAFSPSFNGNGYDWGWCTWWGAERRRQLGSPVPSNWGNANTWDDFAASSGYKLSVIPKVGAIAQYDRGWAGHVGVVEAVSPDGGMVKISDMNGSAGWGRVGHSDWIPASTFDVYIY